MKTDSSLNTYAVSLHFSQKTNHIISSTVNSIAEITGNQFITENKIPPHITIGAFHACRKEEGKLLELVEEFSKIQKTGTVQFTQTGNFKNKVLFLKPEKNNFLTKINADIHTLLLPEFEKGENGYYLPEIWYPHTTLATRLNQSQFEKALTIAGQIPLPLTTRINELSVYQCTPFKKLLMTRMLLF